MRSVQVTPQQLRQRRLNGVKTFSVTKVAQRRELGEVVTQWLNGHPAIELIDLIVTQSSDAMFHCLCAAVHKQ
jgi:hypothetical protein